MSADGSENPAENSRKVTEQAAAVRRNFDEINEGDKSSREYQITPQVYRDFLSAFKDENPLHVVESYAVQKGFQGKVMHGSILNGFISHFIGMHFPGEKSFLQSVQIQYKSPSYLNDVISLNAVVSQKAESVKALILKLNLQNLTQNKPAAKAKVQVGIL